MAIVGIDLGTTHSAVARVDEMGKPVVIQNSEGELITPSVVLFDAPTAKIVGAVAKRSAVAYPDRVVEFVKNHMDPTAGYRGADRLEWEFFGERYTPEDVSAIILRRLKEDAENVLGEAIAGAVITVPAIFGDGGRTATRAAAAIAGLNVLDIINEPTAAALAFGLVRNQPDEKPRRVLVYDLGGGTFDLTVMEIAGNRITMLWTDGDGRLGGKDWDDRLINYVAEQFQAEQHLDLDPRTDPEALQDLRIRAEDAKRTLSRREQTRVMCQFAGRTSRIDVTRGKFEELTADLLAQTETTTQLVVRQLQENGRLPGGWADLDTVLLVGGSTRMPMVKAMLARISGKTPDDSVDPDQVVAQGAALYSVIRVIQEAEETGRTADLERLGIPATVETELGRVEVTNVCSHGLGVIALDERRQERNALLIERNTPLKSEKGPFVEKTRRFGTAEANAVELLIRVMEGDDTDPALCVQVGEGRITGIPPGLPQGAPVEVTFRYAADGRVEVHAREATHGRKLTMTLQREVGKSEAEIAAARDRLALDTVE